MKHVPQAEVEGDGATAKLCSWISALGPKDIPGDVLERAKYLILDGIGCGLVGARVPWSEQCATALSLYEPAGDCSIIGYSEKYGPMAAAVLNGAFIQATELDDYHSEAPLHSASVLVPALLAATEAEKHSKLAPRSISGLDFLTAAVVGFETGPRAGNGLHGKQMLSRGWHSGPVFGCPASAAAVSRLLSLNADDTESAIGIACTQAGGLMAAQYEGMIKRVQHAFAARNGLFGALLARTGYVGIKKVFERSYGGFLSMFSQGCGHEPQWKIHEIAKDLGTEWHTSKIRIKLHACVGGCHGQIECLEKMQREHPDRFAGDALDKIQRITVGLSEPIYAHDGWDPDVRPLTSTGAQMCASYIGAVQLVDRQVLLNEFADAMLDRDEVWDLVAKTSCYHAEEFDKPGCACGARIRVTFEDGFVLEDALLAPKGFDPQITNEEIQAKFRKLASSVMDEERLLEIEEAVLNLDTLKDASVLGTLLGKPVKNALA